MSPEVMQLVLMNRAWAHGPMLHVCPVLGCSTITMGGTCVEHDLPVTTVFPRGRPYQPFAKRAGLRVVGEALGDPPG